jgi:hypothetical protein
MWCYLWSACSRVVPHVCWSYPGVTLFTSCWPRICSPRVNENQIRRINQRVVQSQVVANLQLQKKTWRWKMHTYIYIYTCSHTFYLSHVAFLSIIMESMSGLLIPCLSGLQNDRPYPDNARSMLEVKVYNSIHPDFFGYSTLSHDLPNSNFIFPSLPSKIGKSPTPAAPARRPGWSPASSQR